MAIELGRHARSRRIPMKRSLWCSVLLAMFVAGIDNGKLKDVR
jgi:hypothetical protein